MLFPVFKDYQRFIISSEFKQ